MELNEEDEVIEEYDVFLTKELSRNLFVLQYPTTHSKRIYSSDQRLVARMKPQHKKLELDVMMDVSSPNYDQSKGEQIAVNVDGGATGDGLTYENSVMDYQVLSSRCVPQTGKRFAVAFVVDGQVHLTPVSELMQMQPSFKYMDHAEKRAAQTAKMKAQAESGNSSQDEVEDAKAVTIRFKGVETEASRATREQSYASYEKKLFQEKWISATVHSKEDLFSEQERTRLLYKKAYNDLDDFESFPEMKVNSNTYLQAFVPHYTVSDVDSATNPENVLSINKLKLLPLGDQLKLLMKNAKIMHFNHLLTMLPSNPDGNSVVRSLQSYAVLVKGCWIVKSEVLYPSNTVSPISGTPSDNMCKARDFILCLFTKNDFLVRSVITKQLNIPGEEVKVILEQIAKMRVGSGWTLKLPVDNEFISQYPEVHERQCMVWSSRFKLLSKRFSENKTSDNANSKSQLTAESSKKKVPKPDVTSPKRPRRKSGNRKTNLNLKLKTEKTEMSEKELNGLRNFLSPPRADPATDSDIIVDHALTDMNELFQYQTNGNDTAKSYTEFLQESHVSEAAPQPFVKPSAVGVTVDFDNSSSANLLNLKPPSIKMDVDDPSIYLSNNEQTNSVNMDSINATVALVADQMRQQAINNNEVFNQSNSSL